MKDGMQWGAIFSGLVAGFALLGTPGRRVWSGGILLIILSGSAGMTGCAGGSPQADRTLAEEGRSVFGGSGGDSAAAEVERGGWGVLLESHSGPRHRAVATQRASELAQAIGRRDLRVQSTDDGSAVLVGRFDGPNDPRAATALQEVKAIQVNGVPAFRFAFLVPPAERKAEARYPEYQLERAKELFGPEAAWTLRVEFYDDRDRARARKVAEDRAYDLRQQGETAFYYHGPQTSLVTVGVFGESDFEPATGWMSPRLRTLRERFPHTLLNGANYRIGGSNQDVPSQLTRLPG